MTDPRSTPAWKQTRADEKLLLLLGAILDALLEKQPRKPEPPAETTVFTPRRQKAS